MIYQLIIIKNIHDFMKTSHFILLIIGIVFSVISFTPDISIVYSHLYRAIAIFMGIYFLKGMHKSSLDNMANLK